MDRLKEEGYVGHCMKNYLQNLDSKLIEDHNERFMTEHKDEPHSRRHALMNLLGFFALKLGDAPNAIKFFQKILEEDPTNLNALQNVIFTLRAQGLRGDSVSCYVTEIEKICDDAVLLRKCKARAYFEHATAMSCTEAYTENSRETVIQCFQTALELGTKELIESNERYEWIFAFAFLYMKLDSLYGSDTHVEYFQKGMKFFYQVAEIDTNHADEMEVNDSGGDTSYWSLLRKRPYDIAAKAWCFMGSLLSKQDDRKTMTLSDVIGENVSESHRAYLITDCLKKAKELSHGKTPEIMRRIGQAYLKIDKMEESFKYIQEAIKLQPLAYGYHLLGLWYLKKFRTTKDRTFLDEAIQKFHEALQKKCNLYHLYRNLAHAYQLKGDIERALQTCLNCSNSRGGSHNAALYKLWADILEEYGDKEGAATKRRYAEDLRIGVIIEKKDFAAVYCDKDIEVVSHIVYKLEKKCHVDGFFYNRDCLPGMDILEKWDDMDKKCRIIVVFVSKEFLKKDSSWQHLTGIITRRNEESAMRNTIVPVLLNLNQGDKLPFYLSGKKSIVYEDASDDFWVKFKQLFPL